MAAMSYGFEKPLDDDVMARVISDFCKIHAPYSKWAIEKAWDAYLASEPKRRPTPAAIKAHLEAVVRPYRDELRRRNAPLLEAEPVRTADDKARANDIANGFRRVGIVATSIHQEED